MRRDGWRTALRAAPLIVHGRDGDGYVGTKSPAVSPSQPVQRLTGRHRALEHRASVPAHSCGRRNPVNPCYRRVAYSGSNGDLKGNGGHCGS